VSLNLNNEKIKRLTNKIKTLAQRVLETEDEILRYERRFKMTSHEILRVYGCVAEGEFIVGMMADPDKTDGGLYIPDEAKKGRALNIMEVRSVGDNCKLKYNPGERLFVRSATSIPNTDRLNWVHAEDVIGKVVDVEP